jgi:hypothetical protein
LPEAHPAACALARGCKKDGGASFIYASTLEASIIEAYIL